MSAFPFDQDIEEETREQRPNVVVDLTQVKTTIN